MAPRLTKWDMADYIETSADIVAHLEAAFEDGDPAVIAETLGAIARSKGVSEVARKAGVSRETIYSGLTRDGDPRLSTFTGVLRALGLELHVRQMNKAA